MPSRVKQLADEEAARVEAESGDDDDDNDEAEAEAAEPAEHDDEQLEPAEPEPEQEELSFERKGEQLAKEAERHDGALRRIFGAEYDSFEACPMCHFLGIVGTDDIMLDPDTIRCPQCRGHGAFLTESHVEGHLVRQCPRCFGNGYVDKLLEPVVVPELAGVPGQPAAPQVVIPPMPVYDPTTNTWITPDAQAVAVGAA